jgi:hypothetical protein
MGQFYLPEVVRRVAFFLHGGKSLITVLSRAAKER